MAILRLSTASQDTEPPTPSWLIVGWLGLVEPAAPGDDRVPSPDLQIQQPEDENFTSQYRSARRRNLTSVG